MPDAKSNDSPREAMREAAREAGRADAREAGRPPGPEGVNPAAALPPGVDPLPKVPVEPTPPTGPSPALAKAPEAVKRSMPMALSIMIGILLAALTAYFAYNLTWFILLMYLSFVLATVIEAPVERLKARGFPRTLSAVLILVGFLAVLGGVGYLLVSSINHQIGALGDDMRRVPQRVEAWVQGFQHRFPGIADRLKDFKFGDALANFVPSADRLGGIVSSTFEALTYLVVTFFTVLYMLVEGPDGLKAFRRLLPKHARLEATKLFDAMGKAHRGWFLASVGNVASSAVMTSIGLWICGVPGAVVLGTIAGLGELIPNVGPILGALPALLLTLVIKPEALMWVVMMFLIVQTIQSYTISPLMMKIGVELPVLVTIIAVLVMGTLFGLLGVIVAIPLTADLVVAWNYVNTMLDKDTADYDNSNPKPDPVRQAAGPTTIGEQQAQSAEATGRRRFWTRRRRKNPDAHVPRPAADAAPPRAPDPRA